MILESGSTLVLSLGAAPAATQPVWTVAYADHSRANAQFLSASTSGAANGTTRVNLLAMPSSGTQRQVKYLSLYNGDTSTATAQVAELVSDVTRAVVNIGILPSGSLHFVYDQGWQSLDSAGESYVVTAYKSISTTNVTGIWTSPVSTTDAQGLGSTWTISRISSANSILGNDIWASGLSASACTASNVSFTRQLGRGLYGDGSALIPSDAYSSETSLGFYRSGSSTIQQSYGTFWGSEVWATSGVSALGSTGTFSGLFVNSVASISQVSYLRQLGRGLYGDGSALIPSDAYSSETSLGFYRSGASTIQQSYGTFWGSTIWVTSGVSALGSTGTFSGAFVNSTLTASNVTASNMTTMNLFVNSTGSFAGVNVTSTISCSGLTASSIITSSRNSVILLSKVSEIWTSGISVGGGAGGGSLIPAMSSTSSKIAAWVIRGSASSFGVISWAPVQNGDIIYQGILGDANASSLSSGLVAHSHVSIAGRFEFRLSNVSTLVQNQSSKTWFFVRITPF